MNIYLFGNFGINFGMLGCKQLFTILQEPNMIEVQRFQHKTKILTSTAKAGF